MGKAYYNEIDPFAAEWLRHLIAGGHIAPGDVDTRSIADVRPDDLRPYTQCHFFAGIGVWSYALRRAGWPDDQPVWTGSCPCQPFSAAGKGGGFADERHLWPAWHHLIRERRPAIVFGEQVASKDGLGWLDLVSADMEGTGYAIGAADLCAAGVGAPHIRQRLWFVAEWLADADSQRRFGEQVHLQSGQPRQADFEVARRGGTGGLADADRRERNGLAELRGFECDGQDAGRSQGGSGTASRCSDGRLADAEHHGQREHRERMGEAPGTGEGRIEERQRVRADFANGSAVDGLADATVSGWREERSDAGRVDAGNRAQGLSARPGTSGGDLRPGPVNGHWRDADWLLCRDGKWRPVEPGTSPLAHGAAARVGRLRGYGNAINAEAATAFIESYLDIATLDL